MNMVYEDVIDKLTMYRQSWTATSSIATELHKLVKQRILEQDEKVRKAMKWVRYHLDETVVDTFIARELKSSLVHFSARICSHGAVFRLPSALLFVYS